MLELAAPFEEISLPAISRHLKVLGARGSSPEAATPSGAPATCAVRPCGEILDWTEHTRRAWEERFDRLDEHLRELQRAEATNTPRRRSAMREATRPELIWELEREIVLTRVIDAPRELVFRAWTDKDQVSKWFGPRGFTVTTPS